MAKTLSLKTLEFALLLFVGTTVVFTGCGGGGSSSEEKKAPLKLEVAKVEQFKKIGDKKADGQYIVVSLGILNESMKDMDVQPFDFIIQNITDKPEEQYEQSLEKNMGPNFYKQFGKENADKMMDFSAVTLHPKINMSRYLVFALPDEANLEKYQLKWKPGPVVAPLVSTNTEVVDRRSEAPTGATATPAHP